MYHTAHLFGLDFISAPSLAEVLDDIMDYQNNPLNEHKLPFVITPNADQIVKLDQPQHHALKEKLRQALFILPDGQPIVWFSRLVRKPLMARLTGSDLFPLLWRRAKQSRQKVLVIVSNETLGLKLKQDYDNIVPKQEWLGLAIRASLKEQLMPSPLFLCLGASAEFYVGTIKRSPLFLQKVGLEWLYRLWLEPRRMWRRYILGAISLLRLFGKELKKEWFHKKFST